MITLQHSLVFLSALSQGRQVDMEKFKEDLPWVLLPDAIRCYTGNRELSHFEIVDDLSEDLDTEKDISWIEFPEELKNINKDNLPNMHLADGIKKAVIGTESIIPEFHKHNYKHSKYESLRSHLIQDKLLDIVVRTLIDCNLKYNDDFTIIATGEKIDGKDLRKNVAAFEKYGFLHFAKNIYEKTGILVNQQWFDENVKSALEKTYSQDMADKTYKYMNIDIEIERRITNKEFAITEQDIEEIGLGNDFSSVSQCANIEEIFESLYQKAVAATKVVMHLDEKSRLNARRINEVEQMEH